MSELCKLWVNGREIEADGERKLIDVLRNDLRLKSVKDGCSEGACGTCTVVIDGKAPASLLDSYSTERCYAADENIMNSTRSTDFITPKSNVSKAFRNAVLELAQDYPFARALVNSGRLSVPSWLVDSPLNTPDSDAFAGNMVPGAPMDDAPVSGSRTGWLLGEMDTRFQLLYYVEDASQISAAQAQATRSLASALAPKRIRVNGVAFASIMSNILQEKLREDPDLRDRMIAATPLGRIAAAEELAATVQFLASDASSFITGQILNIDGGRSLGDPLAPSVF